MQGNISEEQSEEKADNRQMEQSGISELEQTPGSTSEVSEIDMNKDISDNKDSTDGNNLQEFAEGHEDEPMEIEETHTTDVITTDSSKIAEVEEVFIKFNICIILSSLKKILYSCRYHIKTASKSFQ